jgi:hypothetical protein
VNTTSILENCMIDIPFDDSIEHINQTHVRSIEHVCQRATQVEWMKSIKHMCQATTKMEPTLLQTSTVAMWVIFTIATREIWPAAIVIVAMGVVDVSGSQNSSNGHYWRHHVRCYFDILI